MQAVTLKASGAQLASTTGSSVSVDDSTYTDALFVLDVTAAATQTADTLDVYIDVTPDSGATWFNLIHFTQVVGDGGAVKHAAKISKGQLLNDPDASLAITSDAAAGVVRNLFVGQDYRYRSTITDASTDDASFTYSVKGYFS